MAYDGNPPGYVPAKTAERVSGLEEVIKFLEDERNWVKGAAVRGYRMCAEQALSEHHQAHLAPYIRFAAHQVTGAHYASVPNFNDAKETTHAVLMRVFRQAHENILNGVTIETLPPKQEWPEKAHTPFATQSWPFKLRAAGLAVMLIVVGSFGT